MKDENVTSESNERRCAECGCRSPATDTDYTLISARFGWRLSLREGPTGRRIPVWHCPECWTKLKKRSD